MTEWKSCEAQSESLSVGRMALSSCLQFRNHKQKTPGWLARRGFSLFYFSLPGSVNQTPQYCFTLLECENFYLNLIRA